LILKFFSDGTSRSPLDIGPILNSPIVYTFQINQGTKFCFKDFFFLKNVAENHLRNFGS